MTMTLSGTSGVTFPNNSTQTAGADLINNTGAGSDIVLNMGQTAYVNFTSATSIPLRIATSADQVYELVFINYSGTYTSSIGYLNPNNTTWNVNLFQRYNPLTPTSGSVGYNFLTETSVGFRLSVGGNPLYTTAKLITNTKWKSIIAQGRDTNASNAYGFNLEANTVDTTTVWTSLGTIVCATAMTGKVWIRRIG